MRNTRGAETSIAPIIMLALGLLLFIHYQRARSAASVQEVRLIKTADPTWLFLPPSR